MTEEKKEPFDPKKLKIVLEKEIEARSAKYWSDQVLATHQNGEILSITKYINAQAIEDMLEGIISQLGGGALEQGMVCVSVTDKNGCTVAPDSDCDKIIVSVAYGRELIIKNREFPPTENAAESAESPPTDEQTRSKIPASEAAQSGAMPEKPVARSDGRLANKAMKIQLFIELKRKLDELWINRKGLGIDFNNPGALKIELFEDSPRITEIAQEITDEKLDVKIDREAGLIKVLSSSQIFLKWEFPEE